MRFAPDPCVVAADELAAMKSWSQAKYQLQRWMWANGCPQAEAPTSQPGTWSYTWPPDSNVYPGNPNDRTPPGWSLFEAARWLALCGERGPSLKPAPPLPFGPGRAPRRNPRRHGRFPEIRRVLRGGQT